MEIADRVRGTRETVMLRRVTPSEVEEENLLSLSDSLHLFGTPYERSESRLFEKEIPSDPEIFSPTVPLDTHPDECPVYLSY
jgi:hypothetical protein